MADQEGTEVQQEESTRRKFAEDARDLREGERNAWKANFEAAEARALSAEEGLRETVEALNILTRRPDRAPMPRELPPADVAPMPREVGFVLMD